jgi:hypothetical protein
MKFSRKLPNFVPTLGRELQYSPIGIKFPPVTTPSHTLLVHLTQSQENLDKTFKHAFILSLKQIIVKGKYVFSNAETEVYLPSF